MNDGNTPLQLCIANGALGGGSEELTAFGIHGTGRHCSSGMCSVVGARGGGMPVTFPEMELNEFHSF